MTQQEFTVSMARLVRVYGDKTFPEDRTRLIWDRVKDLDHSWLQKVVDRIILSNDPRFNFDEASRGERQAIRALKNTADMLAASDRLASFRTDDGLQKALDLFKVNSLMEAVFKK